MVHVLKKIPSNIYILKIILDTLFNLEIFQDTHYMINFFQVFTDDLCISVFKKEELKKFYLFK